MHYRTRFSFHAPFKNTMRTYNIVFLSGLLALTAALAPSALAQQEASWESLMQVEYEEIDTAKGKQWIPQFARDIRNLDQKTVRVSGYMIPLGYEEEQTHFLISAWPGDGCYFHLPGGPNSVIEVKAQRGVEFTYDTIAVKGKLELLRDDPYGLLYRMVDAEPVR